MGGDFIMFMGTKEYLGVDFDRGASMPTTSPKDFKAGLFPNDF